MTIPDTDAEEIPPRLRADAVREEHERACAEYARVRADAEYERARAAARVKRNRAVDAAWAEYDRAIDAATTKYASDRARAAGIARPDAE